MAIPLSRRLERAEVPVIDLQPLISKANHKGTIEALREACEEVGFFYVQNHGVNSSTINTLYQQSKVFFALTEQEKKQIQINGKIRGYLPLYYRSHMDRKTPGTSHQEGFWIGHETSATNNHPTDGPNQWPSQCAELKSAMMHYFAETEKLSATLQRGFALALGMDAEFFSPHFTQPTSRLKLNHYPPQHNPQSDNNIGVIPHTDSGCFTILWQDDHGGLEILSKSGEWVGAPPIENTFVVNIGDIMQHWSDGRFASTPHRVINRGNCDRYSIPLFVNPNYDTMIEPVNPAVNSQYQVIQYGPYQVDRWRRNFPIANVPEL